MLLEADKTVQLLKQFTEYGLNLWKQAGVSVTKRAENPVCSDGFYKQSVIKQGLGSSSWKLANLGQKIKGEAWVQI